jgi:hypothetical protein
LKHKPKACNTKGSKAQAQSSKAQNIKHKLESFKGMSAKLQHKMQIEKHKKEKKLAVF